MTVKAASLKCLPIPCVTKLCSKPGLLYVVKACATGILVCFFIKDDERIFFFIVKVLYCRVDVFTQVISACGSD